MKAPKTNLGTARVGAMLCLTLCLAGFGLVGCEKDEPPPPLPAATAEEKPEEPLVLEAEDAGEEEDAAVKKVGGGGTFRKKSDLAACCAALQQNAANAPPPTNLYLGQAAAYCQALAAQGKDKASAASGIAGMLKGAGMPGACR